MKRFINFKFFSLLLIFIIGSFACNTTNVSFQALHSAGINIPTKVQTIVLLNRYKPPKKTKWINVIEGLFTGEMIGADREGSRYALTGLAQQLAQSPRFKVVQANYELEGSGTGLLPDPLNKNQIENICKDFKADAIVALEAFDSDLGISAKTIEKIIKNKDGGEVKKLMYLATENINLTIGWRIYNRTDASLLDEYKQNYSQSFQHEDATEILSKKGLMNPVHAMQHTGEVGGMEYARRIAPEWQWMGREIYGRAPKTPSMQTARDMARNGDWKEAIELWKKAVHSKDKKVAGRAAYNLAVGYEASGDFKEALEWAQKSAYDFNNSKAKNYILLLKSRIEDSKRVNEQMKKDKTD